MSLSFLEKSEKGVMDLPSGLSLSLVIMGQSHIYNLRLIKETVDGIHRLKRLAETWKELKQKRDFKQLPLRR